MQSNIQKAVQEIITQYPNISACKITATNEVIYESCFHQNTKNQQYHIASVTKGIISLLVGIAIDMGNIKSVNQKVIDFFPEYSFPNESIKHQMTIHHLLTMAVPFTLEESAESFMQLCSAPNWTDHIFSMIDEQGTLNGFVYSSMAAQLASIIITRATGRSARELFNQQVLRPMNINEIPETKMHGYGFEDLFGPKLEGWVSDPQGNNTGGWGLSLSVQELSKIGQLYLNKGKYRDQQIVSSSWIIETTKNHNQSYGYYWWLAGDVGYFAAGDGGNLIYCIPAKNTVITLTGSILEERLDLMKLVHEMAALFQ